MNFVTFKAKLPGNMSRRYVYNDIISIIIVSVAMTIKVTTDNMQAIKVAL